MDNIVAELMYNVKALQARELGLQAQESPQHPDSGSGPFTVNTSGSATEQLPSSELEGQDLVSAGPALLIFPNYLFVLHDT